MISATRIGTRDLEQALTFYDAIAALIGAHRVIERAEVVGYKGQDGGMLMIGLPFVGEADSGNGMQAGFAVGSRSTVDLVHATALKLGGSCEGAPGLRGDDPIGFYGAYFRDLDGNKLVVYHFGPPGT